MDDKTRFLNEEVRRVQIAFIWFWVVIGGGREHGNESLDSLQGGEYLDYLGFN
jgi:hypothetical protein